METGKVIIGLVGPIKAGKTEFTEHCKAHFNAVACRFSHILGDILDILSLSKTRGNFQDLATNLRNGFGSDVLVPALRRKISLTDSSLVIVDGIRVWEEAEMVKKLGGFLVYVTASDKVRFRRLQSAEKTGEESQTFEQFMASQQKVNELLIPEIGETADFKIQNDGHKIKLYRVINEMIEEILNQ